MTRPTLVRDGAARPTERGRSTAARPDDHTLACLLLQSLRALARHHPGYAAVFTSRPGLRLAAQVVAGLVESVTDEGRRSMQRTLAQVRTATTVEPGLDTNQLMDRVTGRHDPRREQGAGRTTALRPV